MCDYRNISEKGLNQHTRMKHKDFENLRSENQNITLNMSDILEERNIDDQNISILNPVNPCPLCKDDHNHCCCGEFEECEYSSTEEGLNTHIMNQHEPADVVSYLGEQWVKDRMSLVLRNPNVANDQLQSAK